MKIKVYFIMIIALLAALFGAAQEDFVVYEGAESNHFVADHPGSDYSWKIFVDFSPDTEANPDDYEFITATNKSEIGVRWKQTGIYFLTVYETDVSGCSNVKALAVKVISNNRMIGFRESTGGVCYDFTGNGFKLPLHIQESGGVPLDSESFPVDVVFTVNETEHIQQVSYAEQELNILDEWITVNPELNNKITVQIKQATDKNGQLINPENGRNAHIRSVFIVPVIEFVTLHEKIEQGTRVNHQVQIISGESLNSVYNWYIDPPEGSTTDIGNMIGETAQIHWDGLPGDYLLNVIVTDGNGCLSETVSQKIEIIQSINPPFTVYAGPDKVIGSCSTYEMNLTEPIEEGYTYSWKPAIYLDDAGSATPVFTPGSTTTYELTVTNLLGQTAKDTVTLTVAEILAEAGEDVYMELGSTTILDGSGSLGSGLIYSWTTTSGKIETGENTPNPIVSGFGTYYLEIIDEFECRSIDSVSVNQLTHAPVANDDYDTTRYLTEVKIPVLANDTDPANSIDPSSLSITLPPYNGNAYIDFEDYTIHYRPGDNFTGTDNFEYKICNTYGNCDRANVFVLVTDFKFLIPNAFSPNGDGINDYFEILGIEYYPNNSIIIINRWGNRVYEANNYGIETSPKFWDGKSNTGFTIGKEELPTGTYFYVLNLGNGEKPISGSIYLDR